MTVMYTVPNQKIIICDTWEGKTPDGAKYSMLIHEINSEAMIRLPGNAYKLYHYLYSNKKGFRLALSPVDVKNKTGMGKDAYDKAVQDLMNKGYLAPIEGKRATFQFSIKPQPVGGKSVDGKSVDGKPGYADTPLQENPLTGSGVSRSWSQENPLTGSGVSRGEINTITTINNDNSIIGVCQSDNKDNQEDMQEDITLAKKGKIDTVDIEKARESAYAVSARDGLSFRKAFEQMRRALANRQADSEFSTIPVWQYLQFENEEAYKAAAANGKAKAAAATYAPDDEEDEELPF